MRTLRSIIVLLLFGLTACIAPGLLPNDSVAVPTVETGGDVIRLSTRAVISADTPSRPTIPSDVTPPAYPEPSDPFPPGGYTEPYPTAAPSQTAITVPLVDALPTDWLWFFSRGWPECQQTIYAEGPNREVVAMTDKLAGYVVRPSSPPLLLVCDKAQNAVRLIDFTNNTSVPLQIDLAHNEYDFDWVGPVLSPDGTQIAFVGKPKENAEGFTGMYVAEVATGEVKPLFEFPAFGSPANTVEWDSYGVIAWTEEGVHYLSATEGTFDNQEKVWKATWVDDPAAMPYSETDGTLTIDGRIDQNVYLNTDKGYEYFTDPLTAGNGVQMPWVIYEP